MYRACFFINKKKNNNNDPDRDVKIVKLLMKFGANPNISPTESETIIRELLVSKVSNKLEIMKLLINESKEYKYSFNWNELINVQSHAYGMTALYASVLYDESDCLRCLLSIDKNYDTKLDMNINVKHGQTILGLCTYYDKWDVFDEIVSHFQNRIDWTSTFVQLAWVNKFDAIYSIVDDKRKDSPLVKDNIFKQNALFSVSDGGTDKTKSVSDYAVYHGQVSTFAEVLLMILE